MKVEVPGALKFATRAALKQAVAAFDGAAHPEFFTSALWTLAGPYATCERDVEIEVDCDYQRAFTAMARHATEGVIDLRESPTKDWTHRADAYVYAWHVRGSRLVVGAGKGPGRMGLCHGQGRVNRRQ